MHLSIDGCDNREDEEKKENQERTDGKSRLKWIAGEREHEEYVHSSRREGKDSQAKQYGKNKIQIDETHESLGGSNIGSPLSNAS